MVPSMIPTSLSVNGTNMTLVGNDSSDDEEKSNSDDEDGDDTI